jgi:hypothetical protein
MIFPLPYTPPRFELRSSTLQADAMTTAPASLLGHKCVLQCNNYYTFTMCKFFSVCTTPDSILTWVRFGALQFCGRFLWPLF